MIENGPEMERLRGQVENVSFFKEDTGFAVLDVDADNTLVSVIGVFPAVAAGEWLDMEGRWEQHPVFGRQFHALSSRRFFIADPSAMLKYLSSGAVKGIGTATAYRIVSEFGGDTFDVLSSRPEELARIKGITLKKARQISAEFERRFSMREAVIALSSLGLAPEECMRAYHALGREAPEKIKADPYLLCGEGVVEDFTRVDSMAQGLAIEPDSPNRVDAGILYILRHNAGNGHTCVPRAKLSAPACALLQVTEERVEERVDELARSGRIDLFSLRGKAYLSLPEFSSAEHTIADRLEAMLRHPPAPLIAPETEIDCIEMLNNIKYGARQREAIVTAATTGMLILTGGPGTGKTTTVRGILELFEGQRLRVALAAPTGRAAKRMSELTGREAKTIHRMLEVTFDAEGNRAFVHDRENPIPADALIVDELSMVDVLLFASLLDAVPRGCRLILVGDTDQLPPVGAGNVLGDLIASGKIPVVELTDVFRQAMESLIVMNSHRIVRGEMPDLSARDGDFFFMGRGSADAVAKTVCDLACRRLPDAYGYSPLTDIQVLCPSRKGMLGTASLNVMLREQLNPPSPDKKEIKVFDLLLREGDKVMQTKNNYDIQYSYLDENGNEHISAGIYNGDIGILKSVNKATGVLEVLFDDRRALYPVESAGELELAYAITVHKSQGCEFNAVVMPVFNVMPNLAYRNLLYTAVTRARSRMILVGSEGQVRTMTQNVKKTRRYSALRTFLAEEDEDSV